MKKIFVDAEFVKRGCLSALPFEEVYIAEITPCGATALLLTNVKKQRLLPKKQRNLYLEDMRNDVWDYRKGDSIVVNREALLLDGQTRLSAQVIDGSNQTYFFRRTALSDQEFLAAQASRKTWSKGDVLRTVDDAFIQCILEGIPHRANKLSSVGQFLLKRIKTFRDREPNTGEVLKVVKYFERPLALAMRHEGKKLFRKAPVLAALAMLYRFVNENGSLRDRLEKFIELTSTGVGCCTTTATSRNYLVSLNKRSKERKDLKRGVSADKDYEIFKKLVRVGISYLNGDTSVRALHLGGEEESVNLLEVVMGGSKEKLCKKIFGS